MTGPASDLVSAGVLGPNDYIPHGLGDHRMQFHYVTPNRPEDGVRSNQYRWHDPQQGRKVELKYYGGVGSSAILGLRFKNVPISVRATTPSGTEITEQLVTDYDCLPGHHRLLGIEVMKRLKRIKYKFSNKDAPDVVAGSAPAQAIQVNAKKVGGRGKGKGRGRGRGRGKKRGRK